MKRLMTVATLVISVVSLTTETSYASSSEISLYSSNRSPVAYIANDLTIYLWSGQPVAYLVKDTSREGFHIYGFNGTHLGWYVAGILRDRKGHAVGGRKEIFRSVVQLEPFKEFKQFKQFKAFKELTPVRPFFTNTWSQDYLDEFLMQGATQ